MRGHSTRLLQASRGEVHARLYEEHAAIEQAKEKARQLADDYARRRGADSAADMADWSCAKCGQLNSWRDDTCQRVAGTRVSLMDACESSWAWARHDDACGSKVGGPQNVLRCGEPRPREVGRPTICAPKSRKLIDKWRKTGEKAASKNGREDVWEDLYRHAFEPACERPVAIDHEEAELTFAPQIDPHSRAIVRERQVVAAVLETLARADAARDADARTRGRAAAEAAYAAALARRPAGTKEEVCQPETHDRLYADAAARRASRDFHEDPVKSGRFPFRPDIGAAALRSGTKDATDPRKAQRALMRDWRARGHLRSPSRRWTMMRRRPGAFLSSRSLRLEDLFMIEHPYMCLVLLLPNCALARSRRLDVEGRGRMSTTARRLICTMRVGMPTPICGGTSWRWTAWRPMKPLQLIAPWKLWFALKE